MIEDFSPMNEVNTVLSVLSNSALLLKNGCSAKSKVAHVTNKKKCIDFQQLSLSYILNSKKISK